ncbi:hypothetical protein ACPPVU_04120 [Mucilaginibacter sp. McL0603]|uniref:hypothetical protein n=1 Tax=Mucilaginibacter sp. McL0603 TaxID=3415670 RepID=UPI003CF828C8
MKKAFHTILKFLLVLVIFLGLQGRVIIRYLEIFHKNHKTEQVHSETTRVRAGIIHCKLQCYTQHFQALDIPLIAFLFSFITASFVINRFYLPFKEKHFLTGSVRLLPLRAPPVF